MALIDEDIKESVFKEIENKIKDVNSYSLCYALRWKGLYNGLCLFICSR